MNENIDRQGSGSASNTFKSAPLWFCGRVACLSAWLLLSWRELHRGWCLRTILPNRPQRLPGGPERPDFGSGGRFCTPGQFPWPIFGKEVSWSEVRSKICKNALVWWLEAYGFLESTDFSQCHSSGSETMRLLQTAGRCGWFLGLLLSDVLSRGFSTCVLTCSVFCSCHRYLLVELSLFVIKVGIKRRYLSETGILNTQKKGISSDNYN